MNPKKIVFGILFYVAMCFLFMPVLSYDNPWMYFTIAFCSIILIVVFSVFSSDQDTFIDLDREKLYIKSTGAFFAFFFLISALGLFLSLSWTLLPGNGDRLGKVFGQPVVVTESKLPKLDIQNAPLVPYDLAHRKASIALANLGSLASQLKLGPLVKQEVNGHLTWVSFLEPTGFFRWLDLDGTPGYITVSASDYSDVKVVTEVSGQKLNLRYTLDAYFSEYLPRYVWNNFSSTTYVRDYSSEIDDAGKPFYVASIVEKTVGAFGEDVVGVLVIDPQTGEMTRYSISDAPSWVDIIQSDDTIFYQISDAGEFIHGRFNFSNQDKFLISNMDQVYGEDGESYYVVGLTSYASKTGVQRFIFVNTRTKESFSYEVQGISEDRAQQIVKDSHTKEYSPSNAIPFMVNGRPTYVMSLSLGDAIYAYGMADIESETVFASKTTLSETLQAYIASRSNTGLPGAENSSAEEFVGYIKRIGQDQKSGNYKFYIVGNEVIFISSPDISHDLTVSSAADKVKIKGHRFNDEVINVSSFENETLKK